MVHTYRPTHSPSVALCCNVDDQCVAMQRLGKQTATIERLFSTWPAPRPLLCNSLVNTETVIVPVIYLWYQKETGMCLNHPPAQDDPSLEDFLS
jgi:hypothetical protein